MRGRVNAIRTFKGLVADLRNKRNVKDLFGKVLMYRFIFGGL